MGNKKPKKYSEDNPTVRAIIKYEQEIEALQEKYEQANDAQDWSMRHFYYSQMQAKKVNMELLKQKLNKRNPGKLY